ncbi:MAG: FtsX-like permease family protein [Actinomycetota bacterium]|nr:FtsX-like permease family protein [Actinomycetota bacterium]
MITALAVIIGVSFMAGTFVLTDTIGRSFKQVYAEVNKRVDAIVRQRPAFSSDSQSQRDGIPLADVRVANAVPGVAAAEGVLTASVQILDRTGKPTADPSRGFPSLGWNWITDARLNPFTLVEGHPPQAATDVVIDRATARSAHYHLGDRVRVLSGGGSRALRLTGIVTVGGADNLAGSALALMSTDAALRFFAADGRVNYIAVLATPRGRSKLVERLNEALPDGLEAISGQSYVAERQADVGKQLTVFNAILQGFALVALVAGAFLIYNTFGIIVAQRTRELALLRAVGASRRQVVGSVLIEATVVGLFAALVGLVAGIGLAAGLRALFSVFGVKLPAAAAVILPRTIIASLLVGTLVTVLSALLPSWRAARVPPVAAMREVAIDESSQSRIRAIGGGALLLGGAATLVWGTVSSKRPRMLGGAGLLFVAVVVLGPVIAPLLVRVLGAPLPRTRGVTGNLARENARRNPRRTASTAGALMLGVLLVGVISIFITSFRDSINAAVDRNLAGDFQVDSGVFSGAGGGLSPRLAARLAKQPELSAVTGIRVGTVEIAGDAQPIYGFNGAAMQRLAHLGVRAGRLADLDPQGIAVAKKAADRNGWKIGSRVLVGLPSGASDVFQVVAIYDEGGIIAQGQGGNYFIGLGAFKADLPSPSQLDLRVLIKAADGVTPPRARRVIERITKAEFPSAKVQDQQQIKAEQTKQINQNLSFILVMLGLSVVIGVLGIANTLALSTFERTREIGLLRAVGMSRRQLRSSIRWEAVLISLVGTALGLGLGVIIGSALVLTYRNELPTARLGIPWPLLGEFCLAITAFGVVAAILPGRRAAHLDVLRAVTVE